MRPLAALPTHEVTNTPPHLGDRDLRKACPKGILPPPCIG